MISFASFFVHHSRGRAKFFPKAEHKRSTSSSFPETLFTTVTDQCFLFPAKLDTRPSWSRGLSSFLHGGCRRRRRRRPRLARVCVFCFRLPNACLILSRVCVLCSGKLTPSSIGKTHPLAFVGKKSARTQQQHVVVVYVCTGGGDRSTRPNPAKRLQKVPVTGIVVVVVVLLSLDRFFRSCESAINAYALDNELLDVVFLKQLQKCVDIFNEQMSVQYKEEMTLFLEALFGTTIRVDKPTPGWDDERDFCR